MWVGARGVSEHMHGGVGFRWLQLHKASVWELDFCSLCCGRDLKPVQGSREAVFSSAKPDGGARSSTFPPRHNQVVCSAASLLLGFRNYTRSVGISPYDTSAHSIARSI